MKTILSLLVVLIIGSSSIAQDDTLNPTHVISFTLKDNSVILGYPNVKHNFVKLYDPMVSDGRDFGQGDKSFFYYDNRGQSHMILRELIDSVSVTDSSFYLMNIKNGGTMFWNKVVENEKYILFDNGSLFKVYNKVENNFVDIGFSEHSLPGKVGFNKDLKNFEKRIQPYFSDCDGFIKLVEINLQLQNYQEENTLRYFGFKLFKGIANYQCK
jgi:hypothetical protein